MSLAETGKAIGKVTALLSQHLDVRTGTNLSITVGKPEPPQGANGQPKPRLNLFLYETLFDSSLKNVSLDDGQPAPLWLVLRYLITPFDKDGKSDTAEAHEHIGVGLRALQELNYLSLTSIALSPGSGILPALEDNPEPLKITFDDVNSELLSKLMQGTDEKYRFSMGFQVRPVMITAELPTEYSLLIGVDYLAATPAQRIIGEEGIELAVLPSVLGPVIQELIPASFEANDELEVKGEHLNLSGLTVRLGPVSLTPTESEFSALKVKADGTIPGGTVLSAGSHPFSVVQSLPSGRKRASELLVANLRPTLKNPIKKVGALNTVILPDNSQVVTGKIKAEGVLLGKKEDDVFLALFKDTEVVKVFDEFSYVNSQKSLTLEFKEAHKVPPGKYRVILRVNGQQAAHSPEVVLP